MSSTTLYPLKFENVLKEKVWGGRDLERVFGKDLPTPKTYGESWEVSTHPNGVSVIANGSFKGLSLTELLEKFPAEMMGEKIAKKYNGKFPLLIKYLDVHDRLSVQVHPTDEYALKNEKSYGKTECWYIVDAEENCQIIMGLNDGIDKKTFQEKVLQKDFSDLFRIVNIEKGDFVNIPAGLVHGTWLGSLVLCEVQQNSDITYRIYDFDRLTDGKLRPLHLEQSEAVIDFYLKPHISKESQREKIVVSGAVKEELIRDTYYNIDKLQITGVYTEKASDIFKVLSILTGSATLKVQEQEYTLNAGDTYFIPPSIDIEITGNISCLVSFPSC